MVITFKETHDNDSKDILEDYAIKWGLGISPSRYGMFGRNVFIRLSEKIEPLYTIKIFEYLNDSNIKSIITVDSFNVVSNKDL